MKYYVYIATNPRNTVLYTGVTNDITRRVFEHRMRLNESFTKKYNISKIVYLEEFRTPIEAITAEKRIKGWVRIKKLALIMSKNPDFRDLLVS